MSERKRTELARYRLEKAKEDYRASNELLKLNLYKQSMNRSYYAVFHAVRSLLALNGVDFKKHSGVIGYFQQTYVSRGLFQRNIQRCLPAQV